MCDECAPWAYCKHLFRSRPLTDEHPTPWSVKTHENRFSGTEYIVVDANGKYVAEATEQYIARLIARGQFNVIPQPEEPIYKRVRRLETELAEAKAAMKAENEKTFREADYRLKKCGEKGVEHVFVLREWEENIPSNGAMEKIGKYVCHC